MKKKKQLTPNNVKTNCMLGMMTKVIKDEQVKDIVKYRVNHGDPSKSGKLLSDIFDQFPEEKVFLMNAIKKYVDINTFDDKDSRELVIKLRGLVDNSLSRGLSIDLYEDYYADLYKKICDNYTDRYMFFAFQMLFDKGKISKSELDFIAGKRIRELLFEDDGDIYVKNNLHEMFKTKADLMGVVLADLVFFLIKPIDPALAAYILQNGHVASEIMDEYTKILNEYERDSDILVSYEDSYCTLKHSGLFSIDDAVKDYYNKDKVAFDVDCYIKREEAKKKKGLRRFF